MAIVAAACNSFKVELLGMATHQASDVYMIAVYTSGATLNKSTTVYSATDEVVGAGYVAGGQALVGFSVTGDGDKAILDWTTDPVWNPATISGGGALIYNATRANKAVAVLDFLGTITATNGPFTITLPAPTAAAGLVRVA
jgi:hypothetical protein